MDNVLIFTRILICGLCLKLAYGAAIYLRIFRYNEVLTSLKLAKSKVAPLKVLSIPRLELCAAQVLTKFTHHFLGNSTILVQTTHLWTDSADVLYCLKGQTSKWNVFVVNRCSNIHTLVPSAHWHHIRSKDNPADILSRGCPVNELNDNKIWWCGPEYSAKSNLPWSVPSEDTAQNIQQSLVSADAEKATTSTAIKAIVFSLYNCVNGNPYWDLLHKYSSLTPLVRVTSYCLRFILDIVNRLSVRSCPVKIELKMLELFCFKKSLGHVSKYFSSQELERSLMLWDYFADIVEKFLATLEPRARCLKGNSALLKLDPICVGRVLSRWRTSCKIRFEI